MKNLEYCKRQFQLSMARAQWWMLSATTGHYKQRKIYRGTLSHNGPELSDDEKLADAMATALLHIEIATEFSEILAEEESAAEEPL